MTFSLRIYVLFFMRCLCVFSVILYYCSCQPYVIIIDLKSYEVTHVGPFVLSYVSGSPSLKFNALF